jgi:membrane fusion protein (multidrug efflux system)
MARKDKGRWLCFAGIIMVFGTMLFFTSGCKKGQTEGAPPRPTVEVAEIIQKDVPVYSEWVASTDGFVNATIRAQVQGYLIKQSYKEGDFVRKGQILFEIDPRPFQAVLNQTKATRNQCKASLNQAKAEVIQKQAAYFTTKANLDRVRPLAEMNAVSKKDLDDAIGAELSGRAAVRAAEAAVGAAEAAVGAAEAAVEKAQLELGFTKIVSPISGVAGIAKAQIGNLVGPGSMEELTTVSTVDPIKVYVPMGEQEYMRDVHNGRGRAEPVPLELILADGSVHPHKGAFAFADRQVDVGTGTIKVAALFPNPGNLLRPGQFARIRALTLIKRAALLVPQQAVTELQGSYQVAVVDAANKVDIRPVKVGERVDNLWVIDQGLKPGERVVVEGVQKVKQGMNVNPRPFAIESIVEPEIKPQAEAEGSSKLEGKPVVQAKTGKR